VPAEASSVALTSGSTNRRAEPAAAITRPPRRQCGTLARVPFPLSGSTHARCRTPLLVQGSSPPKRRPALEIVH
jgi:hypothetical protein